MWSRTSLQIECVLATFQVSDFDELLSVYSILNYLVKGRYGKKFLRTLKKKRVIAFRLLHVSSLYFSLFGRYQKNFERLVAVLNGMLKSY